MPTANDVIWTCIYGFLRGLWLLVCLMPWWGWIVVGAVSALRAYVALGSHLDGLAFAREGIRRRRRAWRGVRHS